MNGAHDQAMIERSITPTLGFRCPCSPIDTLAFRLAAHRNTIWSKSQIATERYSHHAATSLNTCLLSNIIFLFSAPLLPCTCSSLSLPVQEGALSFDRGQYRLLFLAWHKPSLNTFVRFTSSKLATNSRERARSFALPYTSIGITPVNASPTNFGAFRRKHLDLGVACIYRSRYPLCMGHQDRNRLWRWPLFMA
jgi:hypothetical protein